MNINFTIPLLMLLIIPALALTFWPHFRQPKKYRRNRNKIISLTLHLVILVLSISLLSGMTFSRQQINTANEIILVVDSSFSTKNAENNKNDFVRRIIDQNESGFRIGVVSFGYDQVYSVPLTNNTSTVYNRYLAAQKPDDSGSDIAAAINFAKAQFSSNDSGKIVLVTDGIETDGNAQSAIRAAAAEGFIVDTVMFGEPKYNEVQIVEIILPTTNIAVGVSTTIGVRLHSSIEGKVNITLTDDGAEGYSDQHDLILGDDTIEIPYTFTSDGLHEIAVKIDTPNDTIAQNNKYFTYVYIAVYDNILVLQRGSEAAALATLLQSKYGADEYSEKVTIKSISDAPSSMDELRSYDEVILVNVANADMPVGFDRLLDSYAYDYGGGVLTVGGTRTEEGKTVANAYDRKDMGGSLFQSMLPVQAVDYTPPIAVAVVLDRSGSMTGKSAMGKTLMELAKDGAITVVNNLSDRDFCGIVTFSDKHRIEIPMTPIPQKAKIIDAIAAITPNGQTTYTQAIEAAATMLLAQDNVEYRHIIFVTDGEPSDSADVFNALITHYSSSATKPIGLSALAINPTITGDGIVRKMAELGGGGYASVGENTGNSDLSQIPSMMRQFLKAEEITAIVQRDFKPTKGQTTLPVFDGIDLEKMPTMSGFFGTRLKPNAENVMAGLYNVPIYAQWNYGEGKVGSLMTDLTQVGYAKNFWSGENAETGQQVLWNIINALFPNKSVRPSEITTRISSQNFTTTVDVMASFDETQKIDVTIIQRTLDGSIPKSSKVTAVGSDGFARATFNLKELFGPNIEGIYQIRVQKLSQNGMPVINSDTGEAVEHLTFTSFSYSKEYDAFVDEAVPETFAADAVVNGRGVLVENPSDVFQSISRLIIKTFDPRYVFLTLAIALFLLDLAVRKFKFKWPHEIIRDRKAKSELAQNARYK